MKIVKRKLSELKRPEKNTRMHSDKQIAEFKRSVQMFGQIRPIVIDEKNVMLAGNGLYDTLLALGYETADCYVVSGLTENEKKKLMLADNRIFDLGVDDMSVFEEFLKELGDDLDIPGYDEDLLSTLVSDPSIVDEAMSSYGIVPDDRKDEIKQNAGKYDNPPIDNSTEQKTSIATAPNAPSEVEHEQSKQEFVICPNCGEKIWL